jgi:hypothetical protein
MNDRYIKVLELRAEGKTLQAIGEILGVSRTRAQQILTKASAQAALSKVEGFLSDDEPMIKLGLQTRTLKALERQGFLTVGDARKLLEAWEREPQYLRNVGPFALEDLREKLDLHSQEQA